MRILLTGGSGFLGRQVLRLLVAEPRITEILALSRQKSTHPSSKVRVLQADLATMELAGRLDGQLDAVIHLAGLYRFGSSHEENYEANVLGTLHLLEALRQQAPTRILFASTYAVGIGRTELREGALEELPPRENAYAHTKALAERLLEDSPHQCDIYRLGILVGDSSSGRIDRPDGPYSFLNLIRKTARLSQKLPPWTRIPLPVPADPETQLPLVAVDEAAAVLVRGLFVETNITSSRARYFGAFRSDTVRTREWLDDCLEQLTPSGARLVPVYARLRKQEHLDWVERLSGIPSENFLYSNWRSRLHNEQFEKVHGTRALSPWSALRAAFLSGGGE